MMRLSPTPRLSPRAWITTYRQPTDARSTAGSPLNPPPGPSGRPSRKSQFLSVDQGDDPRSAGLAGVENMVSNSLTKPV